MQKMGIQAIYPKRKTSIANKEHRVFPWKKELDRGEKMCFNTVISKKMASTLNTFYTYRTTDFCPNKVDRFRLSLVVFVMFLSFSASAVEFNTLLEEGQQYLRSGKEVQDYRRARGSALEALKVAKSADEREKVAVLLEQVLNKLAGREKISQKERLTLLLQSAGTYGLRGDFATMDKKIESAVKEVGEIDLVFKIGAFWESAVFYIGTRDYEVARIFTNYKDALYNSAIVRNCYVCHFVPSAPIGVGGWEQSAIVRNPENRDSRFRLYREIREEDIARDMPADRLLEETKKDALLNRNTSFFMVYDIKGWHIYIQTEEPYVEQIMIEDGRRGSSLEIFFSPGLERVSYYQWIVQLATGDVWLYHWDSPHKFYHYLEQKPGSFHVETAVIGKGWGTYIFIPWESFYDRLPFIEGNDDTWRFSVIRWGPVNITWGGRVHETGRWGLVKWAPPGREYRANILRYIIRRAWWKYQAELSTVTEFWNCPRRGDPAFYETVIKIEAAKYSGYEEKMAEIDKWDIQTVEQVFRELVPVWMEFNYVVEELRTAYLQGKMLK